MTLSLEIMSGDTTDEPEFAIDCDGCGERAFARDVDLYSDGEEDYCPGCGAWLMAVCDAETLAETRVIEHGGAVVARLRAEVVRLTPDAADIPDWLRTRVVEAEQACEAGKRGCILEACIPGHQAQELLDAYDDAHAEIASLRDERNRDNEALELAHDERAALLDSINRLKRTPSTGESEGV